MDIFVHSSSTGSRASLSPPTFSSPFVEPHGFFPAPPSLYLTHFLCLLESCWWTLMDFLGSGLRKALFHRTASGRWPNSSCCNELQHASHETFLLWLWKRKQWLVVRECRLFDRTLTLARLRFKNVWAWVGKLHPYNHKTTDHGEWIEKNEASSKVLVLAN